MQRAGVAATQRQAKLAGSSFWIAITPAITGIQPILITPSANSPTINAQQQPMQTRL